VLNFAKVLNPTYQAEGGLYIYLMNFKSNNYINGYSSDTFFKVDSQLLNLVLSHPSGISMGTGPINYYKSKYQGFKFSFT